MPTGIVEATAAATAAVIISVNVKAKTAATHWCIYYYLSPIYTHTTVYKVDA